MTPLGMPSMRASRVFIVLQDEQGNARSWARGWLDSFSLEGGSPERQSSATLRMGSVEMYEGAPPADLGRAKPKEMPLSLERSRRMALGEEEV